MKGVRSSWMIFLLVVVAAGSAVADVGLGLTVFDDFPDVPEAEAIYSRLIASGQITPGVLVYFAERDWGMSFDFAFDLASDVPEPTVDDPSWLDFSFTTTYDWRPFRHFIVDPFAQIGAGLDMAAAITGEADEVRLRFHPVLGAGLDVKIGRVFARGVVQYQGLSFGVPAPGIDRYEAGPYRVLLSAGVLFR